MWRAVDEHQGFFLSSSGSAGDNKGAEPLHMAVGLLI